jgi:hypothetical protein
MFNAQCSIFNVQRTRLYFKTHLLSSRSSINIPFHNKLYPIYLPVQPKIIEH